MENLENKDALNTEDKSQEQQLENKEQKLFTQEDLNRIITERLKKYSDYDSLIEFKKTAEESKLTEMEKLTNRLKELEPFELQAKEAHKTLEKILETQLANIPEEKKGLIPKNFSVNEKLNYITQNASFLMESKPTIKTPDNEKNIQGDPKKLFGKYDSIEDFARKDSKEFMKISGTKEYLAELKRLNLA